MREVARQCWIDPHRRELQASVDGLLKLAADLVFLDPPYEFVRCQEVLKGLMEKGILRRNGVVIVEHYHKNYPVIPGGGLICVRSEKYGQTVLSFLRLREEEEENKRQPGGER